MGSRLLMAGKAGLGQGVWSQAHKMSTLQSQGGLRYGGRPDSPPEAAGRKKKTMDGKGRGEEGRREKAGRPQWHHGGQGDVKTKPGSKQVKAEFVLSEVLLGRDLWWWRVYTQAFVCA